MGERISDALVERMEKLVRAMADKAYADGLAAEARAIVAELPEPVDPDRQQILDLNERLGSVWAPPMGDREWSNHQIALSFALAALKRGRELGPLP